MRYWIKQEFFFYTGQLNRPSDGFVKEDSGKIIEFDSEAEARQYIEQNFDDGRYVFANGEYACPRYTVVNTDDVLSGETHCVELEVPEGTPLEGGEMIKEERVPKDTLEKLIDMNVEFFSDDGQTSTYRAEVENGKVFGINYYVKDVILDAIENETGGDLGAIDWEHPVFTVR